MLADLLDEPLPTCPISTTTTSVMPACARCQAVLQPIAPAPMITMSAVGGSVMGFVAVVVYAEGRQRLF